MIAPQPQSYKDMSSLATQLRVGIDLMGSDVPSQELLFALEPLADLPNVTLVFFAHPSLYSERFASARWVTTEAVISQLDPPLQALRRKKNASLVLALHELHNQTIDVLVSAGNTGALLSGAKTIVKTFLPSLRPALSALIPTRHHPLCLLDLGANLTAKPEHLVQFAKLGAAFQRTLGVSHPKVALLNIGKEPYKGTITHQKAYQLLSQNSSPFYSFEGNLEGCDAFEGHVDVLVTDGFTGNIFLKTAEGLSHMILDRLARHPTPSSHHFRPWLDAFQQDMKGSHSQGGAILIGAKELVVKCHSYAPALVFAKTVEETIDRLRNHFKYKLFLEIERLFTACESG